MNAQPSAAPAARPVRVVELRETEAAGNRDPLNRRHFADGKRITREAFEDMKRAALSVDTFYNTRDGGNVSFYCSVRLAQ